MVSAKIMVVTHDASARNQVASILQDAGYEVVTRAVAIGTAAAVLRERPALVLLELTMPLLSISEITDAVRATGGNHARIILRSASKESELGRLADVWGADGYLSNEAGVAELLERVALWTARPTRTVSPSGTRLRRADYLLVACNEATRREIRGALAVRSAVLFTDSGTEALRLICSPDAPLYVLVGTSLIDMPFDRIFNEARRLDRSWSKRMVVMDEGVLGSDVQGAADRFTPDMMVWEPSAPVDALFEVLNGRCASDARHCSIEDNQRPD